MPWPSSGSRTGEPERTSQSGYALVPDPGTDDAALVAAARANRQAFTFLYDRHVNRIYSYCYVQLCSREAAEDGTSSNRFSDGASLGEELRAAGFEDIVVRTYQVPYPFLGDVEHFTRYAVDQFQPAIDALSEEQGKAFLTDLRELNERIADDGRIEPRGPVIVVSGQAP